MACAYLTPSESQAAPKTAPKSLPHYQKAVPPSATLMQGSSMRTANLSSAQCRKHLKKSGNAFSRHRGASGIATPLRLIAPLHGVTFQVPPSKSPFGLLDCRLALALTEFAEVLSRHDVALVRIDNFYRVNARVARKRIRSQHAYGLAADVVSFTLKDGTLLDIEEDYGGAIGAQSCGPKAKLASSSDRTLRLRNLVCDVARRGIFHHILTPNFNAAHRNHLHLDIKRGNHWFSVN